MADLVLADTSIWVRLGRRKSPPLLSRRVDEALSRGELVTCDPVLFEILTGAPDEADFRRDAMVMRRIPRLTFGEREWRQATELGFLLRRQGARAGFADALIAAIAISHDAILLHADGDYERIAQHSVLRTEPVFHLLTP